MFDSGTTFNHLCGDANVDCVGASDSWECVAHPMAKKNSRAKAYGS